MRELIQDKSITQLKTFKKKLKAIHSKQCYINDVEMSSQKILNFLINDVLDMSQIKNDKFRKNIQPFDFEEAL